jgi:hypothetical protein
MGLRGARDQQRAGDAIPAGLKPRPSTSLLRPSKRDEKSVLALVMPNHKRHFARGLRLLGSSTYRRAKLFESDRPA